MNYGSLESFFFFFFKYLQLSFMLVESANSV